MKTFVTRVFLATFVEHLGLSQECVCRSDAPVQSDAERDFAKKSIAGVFVGYVRPDAVENRVK